MHPKAMSCEKLHLCGNCRCASLNQLTFASFCRDSNGRRLVEPSAESPTIEMLARICALCNEAQVVVNEVSVSPFISPSRLARI